MAVNVDRIKRALDEFQKNQQPRVKTEDDLNDEWWDKLVQEYGGDPWEVWDAECDANLQ